MDIGLQISLKLDQIKDKTIDMTWQELFYDGINFGKENFSKKIDNIIYLYIGMSITTILSFLVCGISESEIFNKESIVEKITFLIIGSIGIILTIPITAFIYSIFNRKKTLYKKTSENKIDGNRSLKL